MVNSWLRRSQAVVPRRDTNARPRHSTPPKAALTQPLGGACTGQEVVLDRAIHGLLRVGDGKTCRGTLRNRSLGQRKPVVGASDHGPEKSAICRGQVCKAALSPSSSRSSSFWR